ncbi:MAG: elongation factor P, partial [Desulfobacteraceae bacterium]
MYNASDLRRGLKIQIDNEPYIIIEFQFSKPGKGQALYRCKLRNMINGVIIDRTFRSVDTFEPADLQERRMQYLYNQENEFYFMDVENYEQSMLTNEQMGEAKNYLTDNLEVDILLFEDRPIGITLPNFVDLRVTRADPWVKGDSVSG